MAPLQDYNGSEILLQLYKLRFKDNNNQDNEQNLLSNINLENKFYQRLEKDMALFNNLIGEDYFNIDEFNKSSNILKSFWERNNLENQGKSTKNHYYLLLGEEIIKNQENSLDIYFNNEISNKDLKNIKVGLAKELVDFIQNNLSSNIGSNLENIFTSFSNKYNQTLKKRKKENEKKETIELAKEFGLTEEDFKFERFNIEDYIHQNSSKLSYNRLMNFINEEKFGFQIENSVHELKFAEFIDTWCNDYLIKYQNSNHDDAFEAFVDLLRDSQPIYKFKDKSKQVISDINKKFKLETQRLESLLEISKFEIKEEYKNSKKEVMSLIKDSKAVYREIIPKDSKYKTQIYNLLEKDVNIKNFVNNIKTKFPKINKKQISNVAILALSGFILYQSLKPLVNQEKQNQPQNNYSIDEIINGKYHIKQDLFEEYVIESIEKNQKILDSLEKITKISKKSKKTLLQDKLSKDKKYKSLAPYADDVEEIIETLGYQKEIPLEFALGQMYVESRGQYTAQSNKGAFGLFQIKEQGAFSWVYHLMNDDDPHFKKQRNSGKYDSLIDYLKPIFTFPDGSKKDFGDAWFDLKNQVFDDSEKAINATIAIGIGYYKHNLNIYGNDNLKASVGYVGGPNQVKKLEKYEILDSLHPHAKEYHNNIIENQKNISALTR